MINSLKAISAVLIFSAFSIGAYAQTKVVIIPMSGDDLKPLKNVITVAKENGDFSDPLEAINAIGDTLPAANEGNPYLIVIAPGVYSLSEQLVMKEYVSISGSGQHVTKITGSIAGVRGPSTALVVGKDNASLRDITIENTGAVGSVSLGIHNDDVSPTISNVKVIVSGGSGGQMGIYNGNSFPMISYVTIIVSGAQGEQYGIRNRLSSAPIISNSSVTVAGGSGRQTGIFNGETYSLPSPVLSNVKISVSGGTTFNYGIYNYDSSPKISGATIMVDGAGSSQFGILNWATNGKASSPVVSDASIKVEGGTGQFGVYNYHVATSVKIRNSTIIASSSSVGANTGSGDQETYISDSILTGPVTGDPKCSFVFLADGTGLDQNCDEL